MKFRLSVSGAPLRKRCSLPALGIALAGGIMLFSCKDDIDDLPVSSSEYISFAPEIPSQWTPPTKSRPDTLRAAENSVRELACPDGRTLYLHTSVTDSIASPRRPEGGEAPETRAAPVTQPDFNEKYGQFSVTAFKYSGDSDSLTTAPDFMYEEIVANGGSGYDFPTSYLWPGDSYKLQFFAYAPDPSVQKKPVFLLSGRNAAGAPRLTVKIPREMYAQQDLLVAASGPRKGDGSEGNVPLRFRHALTAIKFKCGRVTEEFTVKKATLKGIYTQGIYDMGTGTWYGLQGNNVAGEEFGMPLNLKVNGGMEGKYFMPDDSTLMMIPQELPFGAMLEVDYEISYEVNGQKKTEALKLKAPLEGQTWKQGTTVTYTLSSDRIGWEYHFGVRFTGKYEHTDLPTIDMWGGKFDLVVISERSSRQLNLVQPVPWRVKAFSTDQGNTWTTDPPYWIGTLPLAGDGAVAPDGATLHPVIPSSLPPNEVSEDLKNQQPKGTRQNPYDLSRSPEGQETANCYVVDAPGYYKFPTVYGNAIKNGQTNTSAFRPQRSGYPDRLTSKFPAYNSHYLVVDEPYVTRIMANPNQFSIDSAKLIWQDAYCLVDSLKYFSEDNGYITFYVDPMTIREGNAVIALMGTDKRPQHNNSAECFWSWHIWVTNQLRKKTDVEYSRTGYKFMPVNLGWTEPYEGSAPDRELWIAFTNEANLMDTIKFKQTGGSYSSLGENPYYQAGRKDPMFSPDGNSADEKTPARPWFDSEGNRNLYANDTYIFDPNLDDTPLAMNNRRPIEVYASAVKDYKFVNLWDNNADPNGWREGMERHRPVKTVYDPCPRGYMVPPIYAFTGMEGKNSGRPGDNNTTIVSDGLAFAPMGYRQNSGGRGASRSNMSQYYGTKGYYWTCNVWNNTDVQLGYNWMIRFFGAEITVENYENDHSLSVRPVREQ